MARTGRSSEGGLEHIEEFQGLIRQETPIEWTIDGKPYPRPGS